MQLGPITKRRLMGPAQWLNPTHSTIGYISPAQIKNLKMCLTIGPLNPGKAVLVFGADEVH